MVSKASNGVIVVETVKPEPGQLRVSYSADLQFEFPDLSDYNLMNAEEGSLRGAGRTLCRRDQDQLDALYNSRLAEVMRGVDTYWLSVPAFGAEPRGSVISTASGLCSTSWG